MIILFLLFFVVVVFLLETLLKIIGLGWNEYIASGWNMFDITVTLLALFSSFLLLLKPTYTAVVIFRPLR